VIAVGATSVSASGAIQTLQTPSPPQLTGERTDGVIIDLPEDATQLEIGKEAYRLVCSACHAYDGSGLTEAWRSTWEPDDQNCWQSKCHGDNHPVDGFYLPDSPPVVGSFVPSFFPTAQDMYDYIIRTMPWHDPGSLREDVAWAVTAHVIQLNGYESIPILNADNAVNFRLNPEATSTSQSLAIIKTAVKPTETFIPLLSNTDIREQSSGKRNIFLWIGGAAMAVIFLVFVLRKTRN
jgi:hypothetical protein